MRQEFRSGFGRGLTVVVAAVGVISLVIIAATVGVEAAALTVPWVLLLATSCWAVFWRPSVVVSDAGVRFVNVSRTIDIPWPAVRDVRTRYALTLDTAYGSYAAWAAPASGAGTALRSSVRARGPASTGPDAERNVDAVGPTSSIGDMPGTASGDAAALVRRRWDELRADGFLDDPQLEHASAPTTWHWSIGGAMVALAAVCVVTLLIG